MSWYNPFSWGEKAVDNILDKDSGLITQVGNWVGGMKLTQEEVIRYNAKTVDSVQKFVKDTLDESTGRSKSRRSFAEKWIKTHLAIVLFACAVAPFDMELAMFYLSVVSSAVMFTGTTAIIIFYFGSHGIAKIKKINND